MVKSFSDTNGEVLRALFFCGERSRWGYAHLNPLLSEPRIRLVGVVLATEHRWSIFREALSGEARKPLSRMSIKRLVRRFTARKAFDQTSAALDLLSKHNVPVLFSDDANSHKCIASFKEYRADCVLCAAYPQIFTYRLLSLCPRGAFNSHPSLLPRCRGAHPVFWAIASGETESGATIHYMTRELDKGDIVAQIKVDLSPEETYSGLYAKLIDRIPDLVSQFVTFMFTPGSHPVPQDHSKATYFQNDRRIHRRIFWSEMTASQIHNLVRACEGSAYFWLGDTKIRVRQTEVYDTNRNMTNHVSVPPGTVVDVWDKMPVVAVRQGFIFLKSATLPKLRNINFEIGEILNGSFG